MSEIRDENGNVVIEIDDDNVADIRVEKLMAVSSSDAAFNPVAGSSNLEGANIMIDDQNELVDLDALFDALNIAAGEGVEVATYAEDADHHGVLTVNAELLNSASLEDLESHANEAMADKIISDES